MAGLSWFNALDDAAARAGLARCCGAPAWVEAVMSGRPFASEEELLRHSRSAWLALSPSEWKDAFAHHPRIGDRASMRAKFAGTWSAGEQSGASEASEATIAALVKGNREYERRFGHIFIVFATGKSADDMLGLLRARLSNPPDVEIRIAAEEHAKITDLRIGKLLREGGA